MFHLTDYDDYIHGIKNGLKAAERQFSLKNILRLRGPAGLFKDKRKHQFCWNVLENCNKNISTCPIDVITYHRKGNGNDASEILRRSTDRFTCWHCFHGNFQNSLRSNTRTQKQTRSRSGQNLETFRQTAVTPVF